MDLISIIKGIEPVSKKEIESVEQRIGDLAKPPESLGLLETFIAQVVAIRGDELPLKKGHILMCADNGVVEEGISASPKVYTRMQCENFAKGYGTVGALARRNDVELRILDIGVDEEIIEKKVIQKKIGFGTGNICKGPAMGYEDAVHSIEIGIEEVEKSDFDLIGTGEMGIGNTTTSSALLHALTGAPLTECVGKGAGLDEKGILHKREIIERSLKVNEASGEDDPITLLSKVGGYDIGGLVGVFLGAAYYKRPVLMDGFISGVAALLATRINPHVKDYILPSHYSKEKGFQVVLEALGMKAPLHFEMALGEGAGCLLMMPFIENGLYVLKEAGTLKEMMERRNG